MKTIHLLADIADHLIDCAVSAARDVLHFRNPIRRILLSVEIRAPGK